MVKDAGEPVKNFVEMSKNDPKFKDYYRDFTDVGVQIFKIHKKLPPILNLLNSFFKDKKEFTYNNV